MNKEEILQFLGKKKQLLVASDVALEDWKLKEENYYKTDFNYRILSFVLWMVAIIISGIIASVSIVLSILFRLLMWSYLGYLIYYRIRYKKSYKVSIFEFKKLKEAKLDMEEAKEKYQQEISNPAYLVGMENFPKEFYNTYAISRLEGLIREERALTLQEAYTILENQQFQEQTVSHQNKMSGQQDEIVRNTRIAAAAATMAAISGLFNDRR